MTEKIYARVVDGVIIEYPVLEIHIQNRSHPFTWYTQVQFDEVPQVPEHYRLKETLTIRGDQVIGRYDVVPLTLGEVLSSVNKPIDPVLLAPGASVPPVQYAEVPATTVKRIKELLSAHLESKLDEFAQLKDYKDITRACSGYLGSSVPAFKNDSIRANQVQDSVWLAYYGYFEKLERGELPFPRFTQDIEQHMAAMTWE